MTSVRVAARCAAWLSDDVILVVLSGLPNSGALRAFLVHESGTDELEARFLGYEEGQALMTARLSDSPRDHLGQLVLLVDGEDVETDPAELADTMCDLKALARMRLGALGGRARASIVEFLARTAAEHTEAADRHGLNRSLFVLREAVRERLPLSVTGQDEPFGLALETVLEVDERAFYLQGWLYDQGRAERLTAVAPEGFRVELLDRLFRHPRADIDQFYALDDVSGQHGFTAYVELDGPSLQAEGWALELWTSTRDGVEARGPRVVRDPVEVRNTILADLAHEPPSEEGRLIEQISPAVSRIHDRTTAAGEIARIVELGSRSEDPTASIVIPLYRRIDFLEHQLAQFALDPELRSADLVFLLDSPALADKTESLARSLHELYRLPFRLTILESHAGYSAVNNLGASLAEGRLLLLLNSDVFPDRPGWLGKMASFYESTPGIGALGAKLLYEDDSLQHAGMYFVREPGSPLWENRHCFKGLHRRLEAANIARPVPAVTGACLMIDLELYRRVGGLRGTYVGGDNEDSDLCLRLIENGYANWYLPDAELYHLEGQSLPEGARKLTRRYNDWLQTRAWNQDVESVMDAYAERTAELVVPNG